MAKKKLSTQEILAAARREAADESPEEKPQAKEASAETPAAEESAGAVEKPKPAAPKSTGDILAAARAQAGGKTSEADSSAPESEKKPAAKKPAGGAAPAATEDILARARAQAGVAKGESEAKPSATKPAAKTPAAKMPEGEKPSVQEMLKAVREGKAVAAAEAEAPAAKLPPRPQKPPVSKKPAAAGEVKRRNVLVAILVAPFMLFSSAFLTAWTLFAGSSVAYTLAMARFMMPNVLVEPPSKFKVGPPSDYALGSVSTKWKAKFGIWIVHAEYDGKSLIYALSTVCTHLGCTPNWLDGEQKFKCPCHGSGFYNSGVHFEGPAPRPLERHGIRLAEDGMLEVDKSVKFQEEMGQWEDSASYVETA